MKRIAIILLFSICLISPVSLFAEGLKIKTVSVKKQPITKTIEKTGTIIAWKTIRVSSENNGLLEKLNVDKGDPVTKGMVLADVDRNTSFLQVEVARARYEEAIVKKKLVDKPYREDEINVFRLQVDKTAEEKKNAENTFKRMSELFSDGHTSREELDDSETKFKTALAALNIDKKNLKIAIDGPRDEETESAKNDVSIAKKDLDIAVNNLKKTRPVSVVEGIVSNKYVEEGEFVAVGEVLIEIVVLDPVKISFAVSERERSYLKKDGNVDVVIPVLNKTISGKVIFISPVAGPKTHLFNIELLVLNKERNLYPGMVAKINLATNSITAYPIMADWLRFNDNKLGIFVLSQNKVKFIPVNQENYLAKEVLLYEGIEEGDRIIIFSSQKLVPGQIIED